MRDIYTRQRFRAWLETLPDEPFAETKKCPVRVYLEAHGATRADANPVLADLALTKRIDDYCHLWQKLLPREVIGIVDALEAA